MKRLLIVLSVLSGIATFASGSTSAIIVTGDSLFTKSDIEFQSEGLTLKGWLFKPAPVSSYSLPVIVMAPAFGTVKESNYQFIAERFSKAGFAVVLFDYPNFGMSGSRTKQEVNPMLQVQAYLDAINYAGTLTGLDANRIGVWGGDLAGGHAIVVSSMDSRVKCFVAVAPFVSGKAYQSLMPSTVLEKYRTQLAQDELNRSSKKRPMVIPFAGKGTNALVGLNSPNAYAYMEGFASYAPSFQNAVTLKSLDLQFQYEPGSYITKIKNTPKLFLVASQDELIPESQITEVYNQAAKPKEMIHFDGNHFSPYMEKLEETSDAAIKFFKTHLIKS